MNRPQLHHLDRRALASILSFLCGLLLMAHAVQALAINISPQSLSVQVGNNATVTVTETRGTVTVSSSAPSIAIVSYTSGKATITGVAPGSATISITNQGDRKQVRVTVTPAMAVSPSSLSFPAGGNATVSVSYASGTVSASSSNVAIATVSYASGVATVHGVAPGSATISISDSSNTRSVAVTVLPAIAVSPAAVTVPAGGNVSVSVSNATGTVTVSSSNAAVATVTYSAGTASIHAVAPGSATISIADSFNIRTVTVSVTQPLVVSPATLSVPAGGNASVAVSNATGAVVVSSSNTAIATVSYSAGTAIITGIAAGSANISVADNFNTRTVSVTISPPLLVTPSTVSLPAGANVTVSVSNVAGTVTASSSNPSVATVSYAAGVATIQGIASGAATVSIADSFNTRSVSVTVMPALVVSPAALSIPAGGNGTVAVSNASGTILTSSSNTAIATVSYSAGTATIHGLAAGSATITIADSFNTRTVAVTVTAGLTVSPAAVQLAAGSNATVSVSNATGAVMASSSNTSIATVVYAAGTATIRGVAAGSATVTIADSINSRQVVVTVSAAAVLTVTPTSVTVPVGSDVTVSVTNANGAVMVSSSNTSIATVSYASGTVTIHGVAIGSASISVRDSQSTRTVSTTVVSAVAGNYTLLAWNNLGMHCFDGVDYSIFSILPPLNTLLAQLQNKNGTLVTSGVNITYEATADTRGSINSSSANKTNFWQYVQKLFGASVPPDMGLLGFPMASGTPAAMKFNAARGWYEAPGIPITNHDDTNAKNEYPMVKVVARNTLGQVLATTNVVLPVSDELACSTCHASNVGSNAAANAARPATGWVFDPDPLKDWKKNILRLHDEKQSGNAVYAAALKSKGFPNGLLNSANAGTPVLCVACHVSNAYQVDAGVATGITGISSLTSALHTLHGKQIDPGTGLALDNVNNRNTCYLCHPGSVTQCLRGAMSGPATQCQSCHGNMSKVGEPTRQGWLSEPSCQSCHNNSKRNSSAVDANGNPLQNIADQTFATTPNQPSTGFNLYRFSTGHGGVKCEACHGATHAEYPSLEQNDNVQSIAVQGHAGTVQECTACHQTVPLTANGGPHGMHSIGNQWVSDHHDLIGSAGGTSTCAYCHGADFRGSPLSAVKTPKTFSVDGRSKSYTAGQQVSCYDCHNGPTSAAITGSTGLAASPSSVGFDKLAFNFKESFVHLNALGAKRKYLEQP